MSSESDGAGHLASLCFDRRGFRASAVESKHPMRRGVVENCVRIRANLHLADRLERLQLEDGYRSVSTITGEAASEISSDGYAVHAGSVSYLADGHAAVRVKHHYSGGARDVEPARRSVYGEVVPAAFPADIDLLEQVITRRRLGVRRFLSPACAYRRRCNE